MMRRIWSCVGLAAIAAVALPAFVELPATIIWNASPSAPIGFYQVRSINRFEGTELVVVDAPEPLKRFAAERGYLPPNIPLLKRVIGLPGQTVCRIHRTITVDGLVMGGALEHDTLGRPMPIWQGCQRITGDEVFLMNRDARNSLDGRYFGPIPANSIIGSAVPLWTDVDGTGHYRWHADPPLNAR